MAMIETVKQSDDLVVLSGVSEKSSLYYLILTQK
jgi:hypothetical protein